MAGSISELEDIETPDQCTTAGNVVLEVALGQCDSRGVEDLFAQLTGLSKDAQRAIENAPDTLDAAECLDIQQIRAWVTNRAIELYEREETGPVDAVTHAWDEANKACGFE